MPDRPLNVLVLATYFKGERFMLQAHARGANVYLFTRQKHLGKPWPRHALKDVFAEADDSVLQHTINTVSYLARRLRIDRIVPMDDYDVETAAALREHLRIPGMGDTTARHFRDKLAMRVKAKEEGIPVPEFVHVLNYDALREFMARVPGPWMLKPRFEASASGIQKLATPDEVWAAIDKLGDRQSYHLLEAYLPGDVYHVDSIVSERRVAFAQPHRCGKPPFEVAHGGGLYSSTTLEHGTDDEREILALNERVLTKLNLVRGVSHVEYIKSRLDGRFYMLETSARVGGAHTAELVEAATGVNLWAEWANIELDRGEPPYVLPRTHDEYAGLIISLARQQHPDLSAYDDPEVVYRAPEENHAGLVVRSPDHARVGALVDAYQARFAKDFLAVLPPTDRPVH